MAPVSSRSAQQADSEINQLATATIGATARDPRHAAILRGMLTVAAFALLGKLMGAGKEMAVAYRYGVTAEVDAYQFLYNLLSWPLGIWCSVLTAVLVPLAARLRTSGVADLQRFRAELLGATIFAGCVLGALAWCAIRFAPASWPGVSSHAVATLSDSSLPILAVMLPFGALIALQSAWMLSAGQHLNTLFDAIPSLCIATAIMVLPEAGLAPLVWGTVAGCGAHLLALAVPALRAKTMEGPRLSWTSPYWHPFWQGFGIMLAGQALMSLTTVIDQFYALGLGTGANATLGYANRVLSLVLTLAAMAVSRATLPVFSGSAAEGGGRLHEVARHWAGMMFGAGCLITLVCYFLGPWVIALLFERGQFGAENTRQVAAVFRAGLLQLPSYFASMVLVSYALSQRYYRLVFWCGAIGCSAKVLGNMLLVPALGVNGIALATSFVYGANGMFLWVALRRPR